MFDKLKNIFKTYEQGDIVCLTDNKGKDVIGIFNSTEEYIIRPDLYNMLVIVDSDNGHLTYNKHSVNRCVTKCRCLDDLIEVQNIRHCRYATQTEKAYLFSVLRNNGLRYSDDDNFRLINDCLSKQKSDKIYDEWSKYREELKNIGAIDAFRPDTVLNYINNVYYLVKFLNDRDEIPDDEYRYKLTFDFDNINSVKIVKTIDSTELKTFPDELLFKSYDAASIARDIMMREQSDNATTFLN